MPDEREQKIRAKAYELWEAAGRPEGRETDHWAEAERLVDAEGSSTAAPAKPRKPRRKTAAGVETPPLDSNMAPQKPRRTASKRPPR